MEKFEYKIITVNRNKLSKTAFQTELINNMNNLGNEGWELVTIEGLAGGSFFGGYGYTSKLIFIFKRKRQV